MSVPVSLPVSLPLSVKASYAKIPTASEAGILGVKVLAGSIDSTRPINVALAMDTSGSMYGERLASVKNTLNVLVDKLLIGDKITVVGFASKATLITANTVISDDVSRSFVKAAVSALIADGNTNMGSGITMLGSVYSGGLPPPDTVVLLTDGDLNDGIQSIVGIQSLLTDYLPKVPVCSLGYGDNHNEAFMRGLSTRTNGTYTWIDKEEALPASIGELLGGLRDEVAKAAKIQFPGSWTCLESFTKTGDTEAGLGSIIAEKPTWVMFSVPAGAMVRPSGDLILTFKHVGGGDETVMTITVDDSLDRLDVLEQQMRCVGVTALENSVSLLNSNQITEAKKTITDAIALIAASEAASKPGAISMKAKLLEMMEKLGSASSRRQAVLYATGTATRYTQQRGISTGGGYNDDNMFSTPGITRHRTNMVAQYSLSVGGGSQSAHPGDPEEQYDVPMEPSV
jgi:hypothetical protein